MTIEKWDSYHNYGMLILTLVFLFYPSITPILLFTMISFAVLWISRWKDIRHLQPPGGFPNYITLIRYIIVLVMSSLAGTIPNLHLAIGFFIVILLDGVDGYLARKLNQRTTMGGIFDMETDAVFVCIMSCILFNEGLIGSWILLPGFIKYYFVVLTDLTKLNKGVEEKSLFGASIAVVVFLILVLSFILPQWPRIILAMAGTVLLCISFGYSLIKAVSRQIKVRSLK